VVGGNGYRSTGTHGRLFLEHLNEVAAAGVGGRQPCSPPTSSPPSLGFAAENEASPEAAEERMGTSAASMADHYRDSVQMIADVRPGSAFLSALQLELDRLEPGSGLAQTSLDNETRRPQ